MSALKREIVETIAHDGPMTLERYMSLCLDASALRLLHDARSLRRGRRFRHRAGDQPDVRRIARRMGQRGLARRGRADAGTARRTRTRTRHADVGRAARRARSRRNFSPPSPCISSRPARFCARRNARRWPDAAKPIQWHRILPRRPPGPAFILANEFFDALPVRHFVKTDRRLARATCRPRRSTANWPSDCPIRSSRRSIVPAREGSIIEVSAASQRLMSDIAARLVARGRRAAAHRLWL